MTTGEVLLVVGVVGIIAAIKGPRILRDVRSTSAAAAAGKARRAAHTGDVVHVFDAFNPATRQYSSIRTEPRSNLVASGYKPSGHVVSVSDHGFGISDYEVRQWSNPGGVTIWVCA
jgi:hypothetical protein